MRCAWVCAAVEAKPSEDQLSADTAYDAAGGDAWGPDLPKILETAVDCGIETAGIDFPGRGREIPSFVELPSESQTNPSAN